MKMRLPDSAAYEPRDVFAGSAFAAEYGSNKI